MAKRKPAPKGMHWQKSPRGGSWRLAPNVIGGKPKLPVYGGKTKVIGGRSTAPKPGRPAGQGMHWERAPKSGSWRKAPNVIGRGPQYSSKSTIKSVAKIGGTIIKKVKPAGNKGSTHVAHTTPAVVTASAGAHKPAPNRGVVRGQKKGRGRTAINRGQRGRGANRGVQRPSGGQQQQAAPGTDTSGIPEMPDFFGGVHDVPSYEDLQGAGGPSVADLIAMAGGSGGGGGGSYSSGGGGGYVPGVAPGTQSVPNNVPTLAQGLTSALGGAANQGTADSLSYADALSSGIPSQLPTAGTAGYSFSGTGGGGGSSGGGGNPLVNAARLQKMFQAEAMFGPKLMAQFLRNQGYEIKNASDYQKAWMDAAGFAPDYAYKVNKNKGQILRNQATATSTAIVRALAGPKISKAKVDVGRSRASLKSTNTRTNLAVKRDARQAAMDQARYNKTIAEINKVNKTKPEAQRVNISLSRQVGYAVDSAGHRIKTTAAVNKAFAKGPTGKGKVNTYGLTPSTYAHTVPQSIVAIKHMHKKGMTYQKAINALMGGVLGTGKAVPKALAVKLVNQIYKPGGQGRKK